MSTSQWKGHVNTKIQSWRNKKFVGDVTIADFANAPIIHLRSKKAVSNIATKVKQDVLLDNSISSFSMGESKDESLISNNPDDIIIENSINSTSNLKKQNKGTDYPLDIWFLISEYISPETVGKFASICKSSYYVVNTPKFWFYLYKKFYKDVPDLPVRLQPLYMTHLHGLRTCVIRTLHFTYFAQDRENSSYFEQSDPHTLVKRKCCLMWHSKTKSRSYFYFKFHDMKKNIGKKKNTNDTDNSDNIRENPEEGCKLLRVTCLKYNFLPPVIGMILLKVSINLMPGFKELKMQLSFASSDVPNSLMNQIILSGVVDYRILDWWHPCYPHNDSIPTIKLETYDSWD